MTTHVQEFIESTIDLIENKEYYEVFTIWYHYYSENRADHDYLAELFAIFDKVEIDLYKASEPAREDIISEHMYSYIEDVLINNSYTLEITLPTVINHLNSRLDISLVKLNELFKEVATQLIQTGANIKLGPFKILRI